MSRISSIDDLLALFQEKPRAKTNKGWNVVCPAHNDHDPSLSISRNGSKFLLHCQAGCSTEKVLEAIGLTYADLEITDEQGKGDIVYTYQDENRHPLYLIVRSEPKRFAARRPDGSPGMGNTRRVLYHLPDVLVAKTSGDTIHIPEGEKDCDRLWDIGLIATTAPFGANAEWEQSYTETLKGAREAIIWADRDEPGWAFAIKKADALRGEVGGLKVVLASDNAKDVSDWLDQGHTREELESFVKNEPEYDSPLFNVNEHVCIYERDKSPSDTERDKNGTRNGTSSLQGDGESMSRIDNLAQEVRKWVVEATGWWETRELDGDLGISAPKAKENRKKILQRLADDGIIEKHPRINKQYRTLNKKVTEIDFRAANPQGILPVKWALGLENLVNLYRGNIAVVAGAPNAGKTALLLNTIRLNQDNFTIYYFCSEMGQDELRSRLDDFPGMDIGDWHFKAIERASDFEDVIVPDCVNIIDYLEMTTELFMINAHLTAISHKLGKGIAIVALQKKQGVSLGRGQEFGLEKPKIYLSMDEGKLTIVKGKSWAKSGVDPKGYYIRFRIKNGCEFLALGDWTPEARN